jgi:inward rectifier potassium channel
MALASPAPALLPPAYDPGFTQRFEGRIRRVINKDGSFNVRRTGLHWRNWNGYQYLINISWPKFLAIIVAGYVLMNICFALVYFVLGTEHLHGAESVSGLQQFLSAFHFSTYTFTTVGYGNIVPAGILDNLVAAFEAMIGLLSFAMATGLLYGRFSRPTAKLVFSSHALLTPYRELSSLQFRVANQRTNMLVDLEARMLLMTVVGSGGQQRRQYDTLTLERANIHFLPMTWTIVHPIDESSPLYGRSLEDLARSQAELMILIKAFDDTFSQTVHARFSYRYDEIEAGARFTPAFHVDHEGDLVLALDLISAREPAPVAVS